uniref:hypothetical protein n=1 Tax=Flavobacterium sp. TaxID=239 RepID=UPI004049D18C
MNTLKNPYASMGDLHNQGLDFISQNLLSLPMISFKNDIYLNLSASFIKNSNQFPKLELKEIDALASYALNYIELDVYPKEFSQKQIVLSDNIISIFDEFSSPFQHIRELNIEINNQVRSVIESELTEDEQVPLLVGLAVAKSSLYYWNQQITDLNSYWSQVNDLQLLQSQSTNTGWPPIDWKKVLKADVKGAVKGFIKSLASGGGALAGAGAGAISSSALEVGIQLYDIYFGN